jgi:diguanylate cyclase (GGDEF)-like protein
MILTMKGVTTTQRLQWRASVLRFGHWPSVVLISAVSMVTSVLLTLIAFALNHEPVIFWAILIAIIVPGLIAPTVGHFIIGLVFELEKTRAELFQMATRDSLTHVYNRRFFMERLEEEAFRAERQNHHLSIMMIDADEFKTINDLHGHSSGDQVLVSIAQTCASKLRPYDILARYGGEEFVVLMPNTTLWQACEVAERIRIAVAELRPVNTKGNEMRITVSLGIGQLEAGDLGFNAVLDRADDAMYQAKRQGRNRWIAQPMNPANVTDA